jgi:hypothetical protein
MHIPDRERCNWIRDRIETAEPVRYDQQKRLHILDRLAWSDMFETFLANKYTAAKRFGLEGCETLVPGAGRAAMWRRCALGALWWCCGCSGAPALLCCLQVKGSRCFRCCISSTRMMR